MKSLALLSCLIVLSALAGDEDSKPQDTHWTYDRTGPAYWGDLKPDYALCSEGIAQTPIDFHGFQEGSGTKPVFSYEETTVHLINNGHTIEQTYPVGSRMTLDGKSYLLMQFHFHLPSEHTVAGQHHAMELHLVHRNLEGELAVIGVFMALAETPNQQITALWQHLPKSEADSPVRADVPVHAAKLLPQDSSGYRYTGSLTTPPCSENVAWYVMRSPIKVTREQVEAFYAIIGTNNRPVQPANGRVPFLVK